ncbi:MAG: 30S ribosomal protein THX [Flavobacteriales bacterium]|nr:30S ribosomal protein THX [Flavobacteriales bacterium]
MGKGDKRTTKGKRVRGSYGKTRRPRNEVQKARSARAAAVATVNKKKVTKPKVAKETATATTAKKTTRKTKVKTEEKPE